MERYIIDAFVIVGPNCFFLLSGYFGIKYEFKKILYFGMEIYFYGIVLGFIDFVFGLSSLNNLEDVMYIITPFQKYWFMEVYIFLILISPYLNATLLKIKDKLLKRYLCLFCVIFCIYGFVIEDNSAWLGLNDGYSVIYSVYLYCIGNYLARKEIKLSRFTCFVVYIMASVITAISSILIIENYISNVVPDKIFNYNSVMVLFASIAFFEIFCKRSKQRQITKSRFLFKIIEKFRAHILTTYYITTCKSVKIMLQRYMNVICTNRVCLLLPFVLICAFISIVLCCIVDKMLKHFAKPVYEKLDLVAIYITNHMP